MYVFEWHKPLTLHTHPYSVFQAVNVEKHEVAACKLVAITKDTTEQERKIIDKEMKIHAALHHEYVLRFISAIVVELKHQARYVPGIYMLMELAGGGDLFDKIGQESVFMYSID